jgi:hypothetical protein
MHDDDACLALPAHFKIVSLIISRKMSSMLSWWIVRVLPWHKERKSEYPHPLKKRAARKLAERNVGRV